MVSVGLTGEMIILAPRERLFRALGDTEVVRRAVPHCRAFVASDTGYRCELDIEGLGPLTVDIVVSNAEAPAGLSFRTEVQRPDLPGHLRVSAHIALAAIDITTTNLAYHISASASGFFATLLGSNPKARCETYADNVLANLARIVEDHETAILDMGAPILPEPWRPTQVAGAGPTQAHPAPVQPTPVPPAFTPSASMASAAPQPAASRPAAMAMSAPAYVATPPQQIPLPATGTSQAAAAPQHLQMQGMAPVAPQGTSPIAPSPQFATAAAGFAPSNLTYSPPQPPTSARQSADNDPAPNPFVRFFFVAVGLAIIAILLRDAF